MKIDTLEVAGIRSAIHAQRNPMSSWEKSDSKLIYKMHEYNDGVHKYETCFSIGSADRDLSVRLQKAGPEHCKHLRQVIVWADITAPRYWWIEMATYRAGVETVSCSTMHRIHANEFTPDDFAHDHVIGSGWSEADNFNGAKPEDVLNATIDMLNQCREKYLYCTEKHDSARAKMFWWQLIQLLPQSYLQKRTVMMSYAALRNIYRQREGHKLSEWETFREWVRSLPESWMITEG